MASSTSFQTSQVYSNPFELLPEEVILDNIARTLDQKDILSTRLVNRRFSILFGEDRFWRLYYRNLGLEPPELPRSEASLSKLSVRLPFWTTLKRTIEIIELRAKSKANDSFACNELRTLCFIALATPQLTPLHPYCFSILKEYYEIPRELTKEELFLHILQERLKDVDFQFFCPAYELAIKRLSHRSKESFVQETLLSWVYSGNNTKACSIALKILSPHLDDKKKEEIVIFAIKLYGKLSAVKSALKQFMTPSILKVLYKHYFDYEFKKLIYNNINLNLINELVLKLIETESLYLFKGILKALKPAANQELVQRAFCHMLADPFLPRDKATMIMNIISSVPLSQNIKEEFRYRVPLVSKIVYAETIVRFYNDRESLIPSLSSTNSFERLNAAKQLAPYIDDQQVFVAFNKRLEHEAYERAEIVIIHTLANISSSIRTSLINDNVLSKRMNRKIYLEIIKIFCSFIDESNIRQVLFKLFKSSNSNKVRTTLINAFAPQLDREDVRTFYLENLTENLTLGNLFEQGWKISIIEKLGPVAELPEVQSVLFKRFQGRNWEIRTASMRALCQDQKNPLIPLELIFKAFTDYSKISKEAIRIIKRLARDQN